MTEPKRHHFVPKFYLERFAKDGELELVDRADFDHVITSNPRHALAENDFYTVDTEEGRDLSVEKLFSEHVEGPAAEAIRRLVNQGRSLAGQGIRAPISLFIAFQRVRGPAMRHAMVEHSKAVSRKVATMATPSRILKRAQDRGVEMTEDEAVEVINFAKSGNYKIVIERAANLHMGSALKAALEIVPYIERRTWRLIEFDDPTLVTCDEPVALVGADALAPGDAGGPAMANEIVFPMDPWHALLMIRPDRASDQYRSRGTCRQAEIINLHVAFHAHRFIVRHPRTNPLAGLDVPKKASAVFSVGNVIGMQPNASEAARARFMERIARNEIRFRPAPDEEAGDDVK